MLENCQIWSNSSQIDDILANLRALCRKSVALLQISLCIGMFFKDLPNFGGIYAKKYANLQENWRIGSNLNDIWANLRSFYRISLALLQISLRIHRIFEDLQKNWGNLDEKQKNFLENCQIGSNLAKFAQIWWYLCKFASIFQNICGFIATLASYS